MVTLGELSREAVKALSDYGIENARFEFECLLEKAGIEKIRLLTSPETELPDACAESIRADIAERVSGKPLQYILGEWEFFGFAFSVGEGVLIPRQDTEVLAELARDYLGSGSLCADLCAGSGCIGITLSNLTGCAAHCYELSDKALDYLLRNIQRYSRENDCRAQAIHADVLDPKTATESPLYDVIVSNPPYLSDEDMNHLQREVQFEPEMALYGGRDGLDFYRALLHRWVPRLKSGGLFAVEVGIGQAGDVKQIFARSGLSAMVKCDYCAVERVVYGIKP